MEKRELSGVLATTGPRGRLGSAGVAIGFLCALGLVLFSAVMAASGGWYLMHARPWLVLFGGSLVVLSPFWLLFAVIDSLKHRKSLWGPGERASILAVAVSLAMAVISFG